MSATAKVLTTLLALATLFLSTFLIVYFALLGLVFIPLLLGLAYLIFRGIIASAKDAKNAADGHSGKD
ncbi:hypothetical protein CWE09_04465 [Aliidiomarina minuta]|uniref:Uncharacterized protein n=1 Tax=Aliidiomarina minuta TaxID=880057 RepID=A0A432W7E2_9GAMM|nr:hypothetical protein [Aliidiomarina minuta]RUO25987.1 hypothetical protein CWE09_04465 [Aliidiomarina minuta]